MYLSSFQLQNVKCFRDASLAFPKDEHGGHAGWFVVLGENGTGKSTLLQAMSLALVGPEVAAEFLGHDDRTRWPRSPADVATFNPKIRIQGVRLPLSAKLLLTGPSPVKTNRTTIKPYTFFGHSVVFSASHGLWSPEPMPRYLTVAYGPRRLSHDRGQPPQPFRGSGLRGQARHASLFNSESRLVDGDWLLPTLYNLANDLVAPAEVKALSMATLNGLRATIDDLLREEGVQIARVKPTGVNYSDRLGQSCSLDDLSDGFRTFLGLVIDLLAHICFADPGDPSKGLHEAAEALDHLDEIEGVVLIDEADIHLHPSWQRALGPRLRQVFPRLQFIVSSHSPFIAQAATPGGLFRLAAAKDEVTITASTEQPQGWTADELLLSDLFGLNTTRGVETEQMIAKREALMAQKTRTPSDDKALLKLERDLQDRLTGPGVDLRTRELMNKAWELLGGPRRAP